jgi:hypothetical protein
MQAIKESDLDVMLEIIADIREHHAGLADTLSGLANDFEYDRILILLEESLYGHKKHRSTHDSG